MDEIGFMANHCIYGWYASRLHGCMKFLWVHPLVLGILACHLEIYCMSYVSHASTCFACRFTSSKLEEYNRHTVQNSFMPS